MVVESQQFRDALATAAASFRVHGGDTELAADAIRMALGWSRERARWFISINLRTIEQSSSTPPA
jgi:hypothetical protein